MNHSAYNNMVPIAPASASQPKSQPESQSEDLHRKKRTRAKRSCDLCRKKKTRCDAVGNQPCSKCRLTNTECLFLVEQKKRGPSSGSYVEVLEARLLRMEKLLQNMAKGKQDNQSDHNQEIYNSISRSNSGSPLTGCTGFAGEVDLESEDEEGEKETEKVEEEAGFGTIECPALLARTAVQDKDYDEIEKHMNDLTISDYQRTRYIGASSGVHFLNDTLLHSGKKHRIPDNPSWFIQKLNNEEDEHVIMKSKEILQPLHTPSDSNIKDRIKLFEDTPHMTQELADYLIDMFFTRVHIYCPLINKIQFLEQYYFQKPNPPDKYLLFAIGAIGAAVFLPEVSFTHNYNFTKEQITEVYYALKAKTHKLLSILHKRSMISTVQTLMLLGMFTGHDDNDDEDTSHWFITGMAIRMAQDMGLHRDCSKWNLPDYEIELRKRIWYSAYMVDRWIAAELGRPVSILDNEFDVELPNVYELNTPPSQHTDDTPILIIETEKALAEKKLVYSCFLHLVTLSQIAGQVLVGFHSTRAKKYRHDNLALLHILDRNLTNWKLSLPEELKWNDIKSKAQMYSSSACILSMVCDCVWILLYRPLVKTNTEQPDHNALAVKALSICTASAASLVNTAECMEHNAFIALPWNMAIYAVFQAAIIFLHNAKGKNEFVREQGKSYLRRCARLYNRDPYLRTTRVVKVLQHYMANFEINLEDDEYTYSNSPDSPSGSIGGRRKRSEESASNPYHICFTRNQQQKDQNSASDSSESLIAVSINPPKNDEEMETTNNNRPEDSIGINSTSTIGMDDMFISSLSYGFDKNTLNDFFSIQQQQQQQQQREQENVKMYVRSTASSLNNSGTPFPNQYNELSNNTFSNSIDALPEVEFNNNFGLSNGVDSIMQNNNGSTFSNIPTKFQQFDVSSLSSEIPIWDLPSGITWNEWESFLKSNV